MKSNSKKISEKFSVYLGSDSGFLLKKYNIDNLKLVYKENICNWYINKQNQMSPDNKNFYNFDSICLHTFDREVIFKLHLKKLLKGDFGFIPEKYFVIDEEYCKAVVLYGNTKNILEYIYKLRRMLYDLTHVYREDIFFSKFGFYSKKNSKFNFIECETYFYDTICKVPIGFFIEGSRYSIYEILEAILKNYFLVNEYVLFKPDPHLCMIGKTLYECKEYENTESFEIVATQAYEPLEYIKF